MGESVFGRELSIAIDVQAHIDKGMGIRQAAKAAGVLESVARRSLAAARDERARLAAGEAKRIKAESRERAEKAKREKAKEAELPWMREDYVSPETPTAATAARAGSARKMAILAKRLERGEQLFHDDDPYCTYAGSGLMAGAFCRDVRSLGSLVGGMLGRDD